MASLAHRFMTQRELCNLGRAIKLMWHLRHNPFYERIIKEDIRKAKVLRQLLRTLMVFLALLMVGCGDDKGDEDQNPYDGTAMVAWSDPYDDTDPIEATFYSTVTYGHRYDIDMVIRNDTPYELERVIEVGTRTWSVEVYIYVEPGDRLRVHLINTSSMFLQPRMFRSYALPTGAG